LSCDVQLEQAKRNGEKLIETLQAVLEESEIRIAELRKAAYEFKRNIVVGAGQGLHACWWESGVWSISLANLENDMRSLCISENPRTGKIIAEKLVRYVEDKIKAKDAMIEKLRLKNVTLRNQIHKVA
jgi:hypothetical protein